MVNSSECNSKMEIENSMKVVAFKHEIMSNILQPFGEQLPRSLSGNNDRRHFEEYNSQIMALNNSQNDGVNIQPNKRTIFKLDSETQSKHIGYLKRAQDRIKEQLTVAKKYVGSEKQIKDLNNLLHNTRSQLKEQKINNKQYSKIIKRIYIAVKGLDENLNILRKRVFYNSTGINDAEIRNKLNTAVKNFLFIWSAFQEEQAKLFKCIVKSNIGFLDSCLVSPLKFVDLLQKSLKDLPKGTTFPVDPDFENAMQLYNLVRLNIYLYNGIVVFRLNIQLINEKKFLLYRIHSLPKAGSKQIEFSFIMPEKPYLLINSDVRQYALVTQYQFEKCKFLYNSKYICEVAIQSIDDLNPVCEVHLYVKEKVLSNCNIRSIKPYRPFALQLTKKSRWIYVVPKTSTLLIRCGRNRGNISLTNSGILDTGTCLASLNGTLLEHVFKHYKGLADCSPKAKIGKFVKAAKSSKLFRLEITDLQHVALPYNFEDMKRELESKSIQIIISSQIIPENSNNRRKNVAVVILVAVVTITLIGLVIFVNKIFHCNVQNNRHNHENYLILNG